MYHYLLVLLFGAGVFDGPPAGDPPDPLDPMGAGPLDILRVRRHRMMGKGGK